MCRALVARRAASGCEAEENSHSYIGGRTIQSKLESVQFRFFTIPYPGTMGLLGLNPGTMVPTRGQWDVNPGTMTHCPRVGTIVPGLGTIVPGLGTIVPGLGGPLSPGWGDHCPRVGNSLSPGCDHFFRFPCNERYL